MEGPKRHRPGSPPPSPTATTALPQAPATQQQPASPHFHHFHAEPPPRHITGVPQPKRPVNPDASAFSELQPENPRELKKAKPEDLPRPQLFDDDEAIPMEIDDGLEWLSKATGFDPELHAEMMTQANEAEAAAQHRREKGVAILLEKLTNLNPSGARYLKEDFGRNARSLPLLRFDLIEIPSELWELSNLEELNLSFNKISVIPPEISELPKLKNLIMSANLVTALPKEIGQLANLTGLVLDRNPIVALPADFWRLSRLEKLNLEDTKISELPGEIGQLTNLEYLNLGGTQIVVVPREIGQLSNLKKLYLGDTKISGLPVEICGLSNLDTLDLSATQIEALPVEINRFENLERLFLSNSRISAFPAEIAKLVNLEWLHLTETPIRSIPPEIGQLINLDALHLGGTRITTFPPEIGNLTNLCDLELWGTQITAMPPEIGKLINLTELHLGNTPVTVLPATIRNLNNLELLDLEGCPIAAHGDENNWGRAELISHFGDRVMIDDPDAEPPMPASTTRDEVYSALDAQPERIDRKQLASARLREMPGQAIENGDEFMHVFNKVLSQLNFDEADAQGYLSYELLSGDYASDARNDQESSSGDKIRRYVLPRLTGYFKELYGLPLSEGESKGWQMHEESKPALKKALNYILNQLASLTDPEQRSSLFYQFVQGMLHCPTGQKEGIETVVNALLDGKTERSERDLKTLVEKAIASKKNAFFKTAILTKASANVQNVHLISTYQERLRDELGLSNILDFREQIGAMGRDPFSNNQNNVLQVFYNLVTPQRMVDWLMEKTPSVEGLKLRRDVAQFKPINAGVVGSFVRDELENDEEGWKRYFTADPLDIDGPPAALTREGAMRVLQKLGYVVGNPQARSEA